MPRKAAFTTLLVNNDYLAGVMVLAASLRSVGSIYPLVVMTIPETPVSAVKALEGQGILTREVHNLRLINEADRPNIAEHDGRFLTIWAKLRAFSLTEYERVVLLDSDMLIRKNMDELFEIDMHTDSIAAVNVCACNHRKQAHYPADWVPENCAHTSVRDHDEVPAINVDSPRPYNLLNSGTVVLDPSTELDSAIEEFLNTSPLVKTWIWPDQDLLSAFFAGKWRVIPWYYNALITLSQVHKNLWKDDEVRCIHYIGMKKPWTSRKCDQGLEYQQQYIDWWWTIFDGLERQLKTANIETWQLLMYYIDITA